MPEQTFLDAIRSALAEEMRRDLSVYLFGEDVALGGPFGATKGLADEFGTNRIVNTPITHPEFSGIRITPNVYTTLDEVDVFAEKMLSALKNGIA